jgi:flavin reductase (DIM6/NTAB) family NADH-FMN oxidoreductase RutF
MRIDCRTSDTQSVYSMLVSVITPRPIAWVSTMNAAGLVNLAPFSFFNVFGANPPIVVFSPTLKRDGTKKDTLRNIEANGEFVVNVVTAELAAKANLTSKELPPEESEVALAGLTTLGSSTVQPPRIGESPVNLECKVRQIIPCGTGPIAANLVIAEVTMMHVSNDVLDGKGTVDPSKLQTVARMGQAYWCRTTDRFELPRP